MAWAMHRNTGTQHEEPRHEGYACWSSEKLWNPCADVRHPTHARAYNPSQARNTYTPHHLSEREGYAQQPALANNNISTIQHIVPVTRTAWPTAGRRCAMSPPSPLPRPRGPHGPAVPSRLCTPGAAPSAPPLCRPSHACACGPPRRGCARPQTWWWPHQGPQRRTGP